VSSIEEKLSVSLGEFLNSPYRGEWSQNCSVKLNAGELRILVAHLAMHPINEEECKQRLGNCGTIKAAELLNHLRAHPVDKL